MNPQRRHKPGADFAFKPSNSIASTEAPDFSKSPRKPTKQINILGDIGPNMANEREPPKGSTQSRFAAASQSQSKLADNDDDLDSFFNDFAKLKTADSSCAGASQSAPFKGHADIPRFGHPTKMASSLKQKAGIFIHQKKRPEHHLDSQRVSGPRPPTYHDRKPPPLPVFNSMGIKPAAKSHQDEVFYTDPTKASADLKALLEGGMEDEDEDEEQEHEQEKEHNGTKTETQAESSSAAETKSKPQKRRKKIGKDGVVEGLKVPLLPHQVEGVEWMRGRELGPVKRGTVPKGGLLADDMGLGKTLQTISLILTNRKPEKDTEGWKNHYNKVEKTTLVVAPLALIRQWEHEIREKVGKPNGLKVLVHHGPQRTKKFQDLALYDVVITTYQILITDHGNSVGEQKAGCFGLHWWRVVLDEAHTIKNRMAKTTKACYDLRAEYRWCLSGTPMQNNLDELQSLIRFLKIKPYDDIREWKEHIDKPLKNGKGHIAIRRLHSILRCFMKRRTKEILKEDGALRPGGKPSIDEAGEEKLSSAPAFKPTERKVVTVSSELSAAERYFYNRLEERTDARVQAMMREKLSYANAFTMLLRLRQVCDHPKLVEGKLEKDKDAMTTDSSQKTQDTDVDAVADLFSGMGIEVKKCSVCALELSRVDAEMNRDTCEDCLEDMKYFQTHVASGSSKKKKKKKGKSKKAKQNKKVSSKAKDDDDDENAATQPKKANRRQRNRKTVLDSDDEEEDDDEGSWLVDGKDRGALRLGRAGGEADENAEGGGDWIGAADSESDNNDQDQSDLSNFVENDEDGDDDSLASISALTKQLQSQTLNDKPSVPSHASASASSTSDSDSDESESDSGIDESEIFSSGDERSATSPGSSQIVASAKIRDITRLLEEEAHEHKFIVFSQFTSMLNLIEPFLRKSGFKFTRYDGSMKNDAREESLRQLRENKKVRVLLCSLKCGSLGLNLTAATRVIIVEPFWNPVRRIFSMLFHLRNTLTSFPVC